MKSVLFDVDGVFLSEERCFDVSALTVYEILMDDAFLGLDPSVDFKTLTDDNIQDIRSKIFDNDKILEKLKSLGLNSNWDMLFVVTALHFIDVCKQLTSIQLAEVLDDQKFNQTTLQSIGSAVSDVTLDYSAPLTFLDRCNQERFIYQALIEHAATTLHTSKTALFELKCVWTLAQSIKNGISVISYLLKLNKLTYGLQAGYIYNEVVLRPLDEIKHY